MTLNKLAGLAVRLGKPLSYFLPADDPGGNAIEVDLLNVLWTLPAEWRTWELTDARRYAELHEVTQPYIMAGVPEEFYYMLLGEENGILEMCESVPDEAPTKADLDASEERYR